MPTNASGAGSTQQGGAKASTIPSSVSRKQKRSNKRGKRY